MLVKVAIVEDDVSSYQTLKEQLDRYSKESQNEFVISYFPDALKLLNDYKPDYDIIFFDISMPHMDGMTAAKKLRAYDSRVILFFVTELAQYAIKGYEVEAFDFIVKPVEYDYLALKLNKAVARLKNQKENKRIMLKSEDGFTAVYPSDITYVEVREHRLYFHMGNDVLSTYGSLSALEKELEGSTFAKCNNCYLVNLRYVTYIGGFTVSLGDVDLTISHPKKKSFLEAYNRYLKEKA